jgi:hypothetical protein
MTAVAFPKMDGLQGRRVLDLEWEVETVRRLKGDNSTSGGKIVPKPKAWLRSNFRFEMGGLPCSHVATIDLVHLEVRRRAESDRLSAERPGALGRDLSRTSKCRGFDGRLRQRAGPGGKKRFVGMATTRRRDDVGRDRLPSV